MNPKILVFILLCLWTAGTTHGTRKMILDLKDVIGDPPEEDLSISRKAPEMFYTLGSPEMDPEIKELWKQQRQGYTLTPEDQEYFDLHFQQGNATGGASRFVKQIYPDALEWNEESFRSDSGDRLPFIYCYPRAKGPFPVAIVFDPEIKPQLAAGKRDYATMMTYLPVREDVDVPFDFSYRGRYITHNPIGNQLMAHGISVIIPIDKALENLGSISVQDWKAILDKFSSNKYLDADSLFLVSTREYATTAIHLATSYRFKGLILEEPETGLFETNTPANPDDSMAMAALQEKYKAELESLECPILIFRNKLNPIISINDKVLLRPLIEWDRPLFLSMSDYPLRILEPEKIENETVIPEQFAYYSGTMEKLSNRMLYFIQENGTASLALLPETSEVVDLTRRRSSEAINMINQFEQQTKRLRDLMQQATGNTGIGNDLLDNSGGSDPFSQNFDNGGGFDNGGFEDGPQDQ